ncbi:MAG: NAD(P)/FAD-dependent oxidoreductase [Pseudomonadota bacterium]
MQTTDIVVIGGGAAGLFCAMTAAQRGRKVVVLEGSNRIGKKILMSGGGRCNFTHLHSTPRNFISDNPHYCKSALARFTPYDFVALVDKHGIAYHEKSPGQLFCDASSKKIVSMLSRECADANVIIKTDVNVGEVSQHAAGFRVDTSHGLFGSQSLVIATGGLSIPKMGASDFGYRVARQFDLPVLPTRAGLVPFTFTGAHHDMMQQLSGTSVNATVNARASFTDGLLFTHRGLSGPAALQSSSYWREGEFVDIDLAPGIDASDTLLAAKNDGSQQKIAAILRQSLPKALTQALADIVAPEQTTRALADWTNAALQALGERINQWRIKPSGTEGYRTAEVTLGGVDTRSLDSKTMMTRTVDGLYFIGEVVDVTGHLGGHNFQWAWASAHAAGQHA